MNHDQAIERDFLGTLIRYPEEIGEARDQVRTADLYMDCHQKIYGTLLAMHAAREPIDAKELAKALSAAGHVEDVGYELLGDLAGNCGTPNTLPLKVARLLSLSLDRGLVRTLVEALAEAERPTGPPEERLDRIIGRLDSLRAGAGGMEATTIQDVMTRLMSAIDDRRAGKAKAGIATGFPQVDALFNGALPNGLTILAARPSVGKTAWALNLIRNVCDTGKRVFFVSLEQPELEVGERVAAGESRVSGSLIKTGRLSFDECKTILVAAERVGRWKLWLTDQPSMTAGQIAAMARRVKRKAGGMDLIVVDYLNLVRPENAKANRNEQVGASALRVREMARELGVPVVLLAQLNRQGADGVPRLEHLRDSGEIEQHADAVCFLHRVLDFEAGRKDKIEFHVAKQRNGPLGVVPFDVDNKVYTFEEGLPVL